MPAITVKNISEDLYERIRRAAKVSRRSINSEIIVCLDRQLRSRAVDPERVLARAGTLRQKTAVHPLTDRELSEAKTAGRP